MTVSTRRHRRTIEPQWRGCCGGSFGWWCCSPSRIFLPLLMGAYLWISLFLSKIDDQSVTPATPTTIITIHDPYFVKAHSLKFSDDIPGVCDVPPGQGEEGPNGIQGLYKIKTATQERKHGEPPKIKLLCMVYTHSERHEDVLRSIVETYAPHCDGFLAASNVTDPSLGAFHLRHTGLEDYGNMWNKVQAMWYYAHQNFLLDFDWFHIGGDDMYVLPENLRRTAATFGHQRARILGGSIPNSKNPKRRFCGGGAGYTLNRKALHLLVQRFESGECPAETASDEDVRLSRCLEDAGVKCADTNDEKEEVRYHHLDAQFHAAWVPTRKALWLWEKLQYFHGIRGNQTLLGQISKTSVSFHLDKSTVRSQAPDRGMRRYHAILYDQCGSDFADQVVRAATCSEDEQRRITALWKQTPRVKEVK